VYKLNVFEKMKRGKKRTVAASLVEENPDLDRFAGSSDEEDEDSMAPPNHEVSEDTNHDEAVEKDPDSSSSDNDDDNDDNDDDEKVEQKNEENDKTEVSNKNVDDEGYYDDDDDDDDSIIDEEMDASTKMANAMGSILGIKTPKFLEKKKTTAATPVVLGKTVTPLQKMQRKEKEERAAMKEKRRANRERNLSAMHLPLSIATTNSIESGGLSMSKELESERFHRRMATRGVVALFNAITQHQRSTSNTDDDDTTSGLSKRKGEPPSKMTKHGFLDKIKAAAMKTGSGDTRNEVGDRKEKKTSSWGALKDDYMLNKKNWDEESSDEESDGDDIDRKKEKSRKKQRISSKR